MLGERLGHDGVAGEPCDRRLDDGAGELPAAGEALEQDEAERVDVTRGSDLAAAGLLGAEVGGGAGRDAVGGESFGALRDRDPEVGEPGAGPVGVVSVVDEQDVRGLDVAVHDPVRVDVVQRLGHVEPDLGDVPDGERADLQPRLEVLPDDERHHEEALLRTVGVGEDTGVEEADEVVVLERGQHPEFGVLSGDVDRTGVEHLDGDRSAEHFVGGLVDDGHAALADRPFDPVPAVEERRCVVVRHGVLVVGRV